MTAEKVSAKNAFQTSKIDCAHVVKVCRGTNGCPNTVFQGTEIVDGIENVLKKSEFDAFIQSRIQGSLVTRTPFDPRPGRQQLMRIQDGSFEKQPEKVSGSACTG